MNNDLILTIAALTIVSTGVLITAMFTIANYVVLPKMNKTEEKRKADGAALIRTRYRGLILDIACKYVTILEEEGLLSEYRIAKLQAELDDIGEEYTIDCTKIKATNGEPVYLTINMKTPADNKHVGNIKVFLEGVASNKQQTSKHNNLHQITQ